MTRTLLSSSLILLVTASCELGSGTFEPTGPGDSDQPIPGEAEPAGNEPDAGAPTETPLPCNDLGAPAGDGEHHPGEACIDCHVSEDEGPRFTLAGTLYTDAAGTAPLGGASVHFIDAVGEEIILTTAQNGNFYTTEPVQFPVQTHASACPDAQAMVAPVGEADGDCNRGGCHAAGFRVWLPAIQP